MNDNFAEQVVAAVGGPENIASVTHCATRLRFQLRDPAKADKDVVQGLDGAVGAFEAQGLFQVIIGTHVPKVYDAVVAVPGVPGGGQADDDADVAAAPVEPVTVKASLLDRLLATISAIFTPYIPLLASVGIIKGLLAISANYGWIATDSNTYAILAAAGNAVIYFFPILLAFTAAKRFGANPYVGATIGAALLEPNLTAINVTGEHLDFLGIPFIGQAFGGTVVPILVAMWVFGYLERGLKKVLPQMTQLLLVPVISLLVMVPATLLVFGPIGFWFADGIANAYNWLVDYPILLSLLFGGFFIYVIMFGVHWLVLPIQLAILADQGKEYSLAAGGMGNYAVLGVLLAVFLISRDRPTRTVAGSAAFVNAVAGITEPGIFGVIVKAKRYFIAVTVGGLAGGLVCGIFNVYITAFAFTGLIGSPAFLSSPKAAPYFLAVAVTIATAFAVTYLTELGARRRRSRVEPVERELVTQS
ncbi:PTS transporter subunit EIIC [Actinotalea sp. M2MS4P-6]|uniref:PTS transporter subunit EIIC n=1 Tax=Actinotalea sp. M2MS4P-6 TaxID=2983762 RepID=UPI0021E3D442|nr:PTS transporter subunit EIIC [Actinotalea sp. M2MS4P-6]MCV2394456.1 PTS transporter subunit EIIC [Actinotalea sp. M2MS4P-6]